MILSASRRTDIPAYYSAWLLNRLEEGFLYVRNPFNPRRISKIDLDPKTLEAIVFWTKNPAPMLDRIQELRRRVRACYFQFTVNAYDDDVETNLADKEQTIIPAFKKLSGMLGRSRVVWRYDPIFLNARYTIGWHIKQFGKLAAVLAPHTEKCVISFLDLYQKTKRNMAGLGLARFSPADQRLVASELARIAQRRNLVMETCAEPLDLSDIGIKHGHCVDADLLSKLLGKPKTAVKAAKDKNQRPWCGCAPSIDIGAYNSCPNRCLYCYANTSDAKVRANCARHDPASPLLIGEVSPLDTVAERRDPAFSTLF